jgi:hypothetical protein
MKVKHLRWFQMDSPDDEAVDSSEPTDHTTSEMADQPATETLVPLGSDDPSLANVYVPIPSAGISEAGIADAGAADAAPADDEITREAQAWARNLIASGAVAGIAATAPSYGPPHRPTHEIVEDAQGRRVLRRVGFSAY